MILNDNSTQQINTLVIQLQNRITNLNNELKSLNKEISDLDSEISDLERKVSSNTNDQENDIAAMNAKIKANTEAISGKADKNHTHIKSQITDFDHNHDDRYYTESEVDTKLSDKANKSHTHTKSEITDFDHTHDDRYYTESEVDAKLSADLADKQDFRIFKSLEEFNEKKGTSLTVVSGIDNMKDIANAMSNGEMLIIITRYELQSDVYFGLTTSTGWTKMFTFVKSNGLCDVECRTTFPLTLKRVLNSDGVIGDWQQLVTSDDIFRVGNRRNTIGWADLSKDVVIDGSSNFANDVGRVEGHNAIIEVSNPITSYQWPVTNSGDRNRFMDFGGDIQLFVDKVNNHLYVRFADSVDMSSWGEIATMDKVAQCVEHKNPDAKTVSFELNSEFWNCGTIYGNTNNGGNFKYDYYVTLDHIELIKQDGYGQQGSITASLSGTTLTLTADGNTTIKTVTIIKS